MKTWPLALAGIAVLLYAQQSQAGQGDAAGGAAGEPFNFDWSSLFGSETFSGEAAMIDPTGNVHAFLAMIRAAEGTNGANGYRMLFGGALFDSYADHPRRLVEAKSGSVYLKSSAAGAYQILMSTWDSVIQPHLHLPDFGPASQDAAAVLLISRRHAYDDVVAGRLADAVQKCAPEWASLAGAGYGQPEKSVDWLAQRFADAGGVFA